MGATRNIYVWLTAPLTLISAFLLALLWEFVFEPNLGTLFPAGYPVESTPEHWEYVWTSTIFAGLALIVPTLLLLRAESKHRRAVGDLRASERRFRLLYEASPCMTMTVDSHGRIESVNAVASFELGYRPGGLDGKPVAILSPANWSPDLADRLARCRESPRDRDDFESPLRRADGTTLWARHTVRAIDQANGPAMLVVSEDITVERRRTRRLSHEASHDPLTGLVNRRELDRRLNAAVATARTGSTQHVLAYMDLDNFKGVNDEFGHAAGDCVLRRIATALETQVRDDDTLARVGGDELVLLVENCSLSEARRVIDAIPRAVRELNLNWNGNSLAVGISVGVVAVNEATVNTRDALTAADVACYTAKRRGGNRVFWTDASARRQRRGDKRPAGANDAP